MFRFNDAVKLDVATLMNKARVRTAGKDDPSAVAGKDGEVVVQDQVTVFSCFFYMH